MKVKLKGLSTNIELIFVDHFSYTKLFGYNNTFCDYAKNVSETLVYTMWQPSGFNNSLPIETFQDKGVGEIGSAYRGTSYGEKVITWNFKPSFLTQNGVSPQKIINALVNSGEIVEVEVNDLYKGYFVFSNETTTEGGLISMFTANTNNGTFWSKGFIAKDLYVLEQYPMLPITLPQILLSNTSYPMQIQIISETFINPKITIGGDVNGTWTSFELKINDDQTLTYDNSTNNDTYIIIDSELLTIVNQDNEDRSSEVFSTNSNKFPQLVPVINNWVFKVNGEDDLSDITNIPTNMVVSVEYEELSSTIEGDV